MEITTILVRGRLVEIRLGLVNGAWRAGNAELGVDVSGPSRQAALVAARDVLEAISVSGRPA